MLITRTSTVSGISRTMDLPITQEQLDIYNTGILYLQDCFPDCTASQREFIKTGITDDEWAALFGENE